MMAVFGRKGEAAGRHEEAAFKDRLKLALDAIHNLSGPGGLGGSVAKQELAKAGEKGRGGAVAGGIGHPYEKRTISGDDPVVEIAADLHERMVMDRKAPTAERREAGRENGLLRQPRSLEVLLVTPAPLLQFDLLREKLFAERMKPDMSINTGPEDGNIDRFGDEIVCPGAQTLNLMFGIRMAGEHYDGRLSDLGVGRRADDLAHLRAVEIGHLVIKYDNGGATSLDQLYGFEAILALDDLIIPMD